MAPLAVPFKIPIRICSAIYYMGLWRHGRESPRYYTLLLHCDPKPKFHNRFKLLGLCLLYIGLQGESPRYCESRTILSQDTQRTNGWTISIIMSAKRTFHASCSSLGIYLVSCSPDDTASRKKMIAQVNMVRPLLITGMLCHRNCRLIVHINHRRWQATNTELRE
ncbi:hypothetical protein PsorP6_001511 [Peronosclerospora sorghi]|uniref:Uncharacterized protein n=1 Tax=Peronosclerospora sorghi TaxID=230839 RepID=A0ACC0WWA7_9STRA|nr:hypothetical protein PsorP6_001511 [Peronosclerospora sorghi]